MELNELKKNIKRSKAVLKLDKNFHIYIHGNRDLITANEDDKGKYVKVYFEKIE